MMNTDSPESVEDNGALIKLISRVEQLSGDDGGVTEAGGLTANFLTVQHDVASVSSDERHIHITFTSSFIDMLHHLL